MERKRYTIAILLLAMMIWPFATTIAQTPRAIAFEGIENARDMGGLVMQDGRAIRTGMLLRSGNLNKASDADVAILKDRYHLTDVFDFRLEPEATAAPDRVLGGVSYTHLSTLPQAFIAAFSTSRTDTARMDPKSMMATLVKHAFDPQAQAVAQKLYPAIVTDAQAQRYYGQFLREVLEAEGGVLWHCSQGKDRAGLASALLLAALGAGRDVIVEDFDLSNQSYAPQVEAISARISGKEGAEAALEFIRAMVGVSRKNFEATLDLIDQKYGSLPDYVRNQLGFSKKQQKQLRKKYLQ